MLVTNTIKLYPNNKQKSFFKRSAGVARFSYNWALSECKKQFQNGNNKISAYALMHLQNSIKRTEFPWMMEVGKCAPHYAINNLERAFIRFFKKTSKYPKYKKKGVKDSFVAGPGHKFKQKDYKIWIPRLGWVKCAENIRFEGKVMKVTVKRRANVWFAYVNIEIKELSNETPSVRENQSIVGVDLGIKSMAVTSDGQVFENPKALKSKLKSLKRQHRSLSRKALGGKNRMKQRNRLSRLHYKISCIRNTKINQITTDIVKNYQVIVLEALPIKDMIKNHKLAQALSDVSLSEFRRQIEYKAKWRGKEVILADRYFPSSKLCSSCGCINDHLELKDRLFKCESCGLTICRDLNAAKNLAKYGSTAKYAESQASGEGSSSVEILNSPSMKEEVELLKISST